MSVRPAVNIFWFRRDLRLDDNAALYHALRADRPVLPVFIFDRDILDYLEEKRDRRLAFIHSAIVEMQEQLVKMGSSLEVHYGFPLDIFKDLTQRFDIGAVFTNHDYEPYATRRDSAVGSFLKETGIGFETFKDQVIFDKNEVVKDDGSPYTVFTPYSKRWKSNLKPFFFQSYPTRKYSNNFHRSSAASIPSLDTMGFEAFADVFLSKNLKVELVKKYTAQRDFPALEGTSKMGVHLRFGTVSVRFLVREALALNETYLNELIWRDFYQMILWHFPQVGEGKAFKSQYDSIQWRNDEQDFNRWCEGSTGYPIVDAGMRELNATGFMHNRVRMVVASFLTKHLLIDWRWGEAYFAQKLLDFDLASNNGGWQWAAGSGCDAAPYFRIFNPYLQTKKFDPELKYIRKWVPEFEDFSYPKPIVDHEFARKRCLDAYSVALKDGL